MCKCVFQCACVHAWGSVCMVCLFSQRPPIRKRSPNEQKKLNAFKAFLTIQLGKKGDHRKAPEKTPVKRKEASKKISEKRREGDKCTG